MFFKCEIQTASSYSVAFYSDSNCIHNERLLCVCAEYSRHWYI